MAVWKRILIILVLLLGITGLAALVVVTGALPMPQLLGPAPTEAEITLGQAVHLPEAVSGEPPGEAAQSTLPAPAQPPADAFPDCLTTGDQAYIARMLELVNQARAEAGLPALAQDSRLDTAARLHTREMICTGYVSHTGRDGSGPQDRMLAQGYQWKYYGENIYAGPPHTPEAAFNAMMNSAGHRANILNPKFEDIGISYEYQQGSPYGGYFTLDFGLD